MRRIQTPTVIFVDKTSWLAGTARVKIEASWSSERFGWLSSCQWIPVRDSDRVLTMTIKAGLAAMRNAIPRPFATNIEVEVLLHVGR